MICPKCNNTRWQNGDAADCNPAHAGSTPALVSICDYCDGQGIVHCCDGLQADKKSVDKPDKRN